MPDNHNKSSDDLPPQPKETVIESDSSNPQPQKKTVDELSLKGVQTISTVNSKASHCY